MVMHKSLQVALAVVVLTAAVFADGYGKDGGKGYEKEHSRGDPRVPVNSDPCEALFRGGRRVPRGSGHDDYGKGHGDGRAFGVNDACPNPNATATSLGALSISDLNNKIFPQDLAGTIKKAALIFAEQAAITIPTTLATAADVKTFVSRVFNDTNQRLWNLHNQFSCSVAVTMFRIFQNKCQIVGAAPFATTTTTTTTTTTPAPRRKGRDAKWDDDKHGGSKDPRDMGMNDAPQCTNITTLVKTNPKTFTLADLSTAFVAECKCVQQLADNFAVKLNSMKVDGTMNATVIVQMFHGLHESKMGSFPVEDLTNGLLMFVARTPKKNPVKG